MTQSELMLNDESRQSFWRTLLTFNVTRVMIAFVLLGYLSFGLKRDSLPAAQFLFWQSGLVYLVLASGFVLLAVYFRRRFFLQLLSQICVDLIFVTLIYVEAGGAKSGLAILYLFPLAGTAILAPLLVALFFVSVVTIILLTESGYRMLTSAPDESWLQAGLYGAAFFAAIFVISRLAAGLIKQEDLAAQRGRDLQIQEAINRLVIADMGDGILVVGQHAEIFAGNPAAEHMLGLSLQRDQPFCKMTEIPFLIPIADAFFNWTATKADASSRKSGASTFVVVKHAETMSLQESITVWGSRRELTTHLKLRFASVDEAGLGQDRTVIFLQDVTEIENRAQQLKLASMGRLTASIAHEVRNPLSAISYASSLLSEDELSPEQTRLLHIIAENVARMDRMIEDILKLSRKAQHHGKSFLLATIFAEILEEFQQNHQLPPDRVYLGNMEGYQVWFDPLHLREVLVNLLANAIRYASKSSGSIRIHAMYDAANRVELHVQDDGAPIPPDVRAHLFEPFYTTSSKGTGLGLYVARELCLNNGAKIDYEYRTDAAANGTEVTSGRFVITFAVDDPR
ncbi:two-component system sensor histidine kinase PilS [soil metagenome]